MSPFNSIEKIAYTVKHLKVRPPVWMRDVFSARNGPTPDQVERFEVEGQKFLEMVKYYDVPREELGELIGRFQDNSLAKQTKMIAEEFGATTTEILQIGNFRETPTLWSCPVCNLSKRRLFSADMGSLKRVRLERHHDHIEDYFGVFRFRRTVVCSDCNNYDVRLKASFSQDRDLPLIRWQSHMDERAAKGLRHASIGKVLPFFSFSPLEMRRLVALREDPTRVTNVEKSAAKEIYLDQVSGGIEQLLASCRDFMTSCGTDSAVRDEDGATLHKAFGVEHSTLSWFLESLIELGEDHTVGPGDDVFYFRSRGTRITTAPSKVCPEELVYETDDYSFSMVPFTPVNRAFPVPNVCQFYLKGAPGDIERLNPFIEEEHGYSQFLKWWNVCRAFDVDDTNLANQLDGTADGPWSDMTTKLKSCTRKEQLRIDFTDAYVRAGEHWVCRVCKRNKMEARVFTKNSKRTVSACMVYSSYPFEGKLLFPPTIICMGCQDFANRANKIAQTCIEADLELVRGFCSWSFGNGDAVASQFALRFRLSPTVLYFLRKYQKGSLIPREKVVAGIRWWLDMVDRDEFPAQDASLEGVEEKAFEAKCRHLLLDPEMARKVLVSMAQDRGINGGQTIRPGSINVAPVFRAKTESPSFDGDYHQEMVFNWIKGKFVKAFQESTDLSQYCRTLAEFGIQMQITERKGVIITRYMACHVSSEVAFKRDLVDGSDGGLTINKAVYDCIVSQLRERNGSMTIDEIVLPRDIRGR